MDSPMYHKGVERWGPLFYRKEARERKEKQQLQRWNFYLKGGVHRMARDNNILYFYDNLDVRFCPKNGMSSLKGFYELLGTVPYWQRDIVPQMKPRHTFAHTRILNVFDHCFWNELPFRKDSYRVALKRDPVERFLSCVNMLHKDSKRNQNLDELSKVSPYPMDYYNMTLEEIVSGLEDGTVNNTHLQPQTYFMGNVKEYDKVFYTKDLKDLITFICEYRDFIPSDIKEKACRIHHNISEKFYDYDSLEYSTVERIKKIYEIDYINGWC